MEQYSNIGSCSGAFRVNVWFQYRFIDSVIFNLASCMVTCMVMITGLSGVDSNVLPMICTYDIHKQYQNIALATKSSTRSRQRTETGPHYRDSLVEHSATHATSNHFATTICSLFRRLIRPVASRSVTLST